MNLDGISQRALARTEEEELVPRHGAEAEHRLVQDEERPGRQRLRRQRVFRVRRRPGAPDDIAGHVQRLGPVVLQLDLERPGAGRAELVKHQTPRREFFRAGRPDPGGEFGAKDHVRVVVGRALVHFHRQQVDATHQVGSGDRDGTGERRVTYQVARQGEVRHRARPHVPAINLHPVKIEDRAVVHRHVEPQFGVCGIAGEGKSLAQIVRHRPQRQLRALQVRVAEKLHLAQPDKAEVATREIGEVGKFHVARRDASEVDDLGKVGLGPRRLIEHLARNKI